MPDREFGKGSNTSCCCQTHSKSIPAFPGTHIIPFPELHGNSPWITPCVRHSATLSSSSLSSLLCPALLLEFPAQEHLCAPPLPSHSPGRLGRVSLPGILPASCIPGFLLLSFCHSCVLTSNHSVFVIKKVLFPVAKCSLTPLSDPVSQAESLKIHPSVRLWTNHSKYNSFELCSHHNPQS